VGQGDFLCEDTWNSLKESLPAKVPWVGLLFNRSHPQAHSWWNENGRSKGQVNKGHGLGDVLSKTKPDVVEPVDGVEPEPVR